MRYEEYRPTIYDWLPEIPVHWKGKTIRSITTVSSEKRGDREAVLLSVYREYGVVIKSSRNDNHNVESEDLSNYKMVYAGDLVMNKMKMWQGSLGVSKYDGVVSPAYIVCHITDDSMNRHYLHMLLRSPLFKTYYNRVSYGVRVGQWDMRYADFKCLEIPVPPRTEQDQIVRYLDWQVSKINKLITAKKHEISVLEEERQALIDTLVLRSPYDTQMKSIKLSWDASIPSTWSSCKFNQVFNFGKGLAITKANLLPSGIPVISYGQVHSKTNKGTGLNDSLIRYVSDKYVSSSPNSLVHEGDFIFADTSEDFLGVGNCVYVDCDNTLLAGYHTIIAHPKDKTKRRFLAYLFLSSAWRNSLRKQVNGVKVYSITQRMLKNTCVILPPQEEQAEIVKVLDTQCTRIDALTNAIRTEIENLQECRTRIISDVVTGQIDVRGIEVPDFEMVEETDEPTDEEDVSDEAEDQEEE